MFKICHFKGNQMNVQYGRNLEFKTFDELADRFSICIKGDKHHSYFVRGELDPIYRKDDNLATSNIFVIDGDGSKDDPHSAPLPAHLHAILVEHDINHFIYTTHSHGFEKNKFRCVIEVEEHRKPELKQLAANIVGFLHINDFPLLYVKEMNTWSQPWFMPTRDDPDDSLFYFAKYTTGKFFKRDKQVSAKEVEAIAQIVQSGEHTINDLIKQIQEGVTYHAPLMTLSFQYIADGMNKKLACETLRAIMMGCKTQDQRWKERFDSIDGLVDGAVARVGEKKAEEEAVEEDQFVPEEYKEIMRSTDMVKIIRPPGMLNDLFDAALAHQHLPSDVFAFASAMGLVAGICGRKFNVSGTGLNIELLVIARTGRGKDSIRKFITQTLYSLNENGGTSSFLAPARFTGPVAMYNALKDSRCCVSVQTECGLIKASDAGDASGIIRYQLGLYSSSGQHEVMGAEGYSAKDNSIQALNAAAMTFIMESTAESFSTIFSSEKALTSGELPRVGIYRETDHIPETNFNIATGLPDHLREKLKYLATICSREQTRPTPEVINLKVENTAKAQKINERWRKVMNEEFDTQMLMATRNMLRTLKYAAIAAAINNEPGDEIIHDAELDWANQIVEAEFKSIATFFKQAVVEGSIYDAAKRAKLNITKALSGHERGNRAPPADLAKQSIMPVSIFKEIVLNVKLVRDLTDKKGGTRDGAQKLLDYLVTNRYCSKPYRVLSSTGRHVMAIKFLKEFESL